MLVLIHLYNKIKKVKILKKYNLLKKQVELAEKKRTFIRDNKSWADLRQLKKLKLAVKDSLENK